MWGLSVDVRRRCVTNGFSALTPLEREITRRVMPAPRLAGRRVAVVAGLMTPFVKAGTVFNDLSALDLGRIVVSELVQRADLDPLEIDQVVFGTVIPSLVATSIAREVRGRPLPSWEEVSAGMHRALEAALGRPLLLVAGKEGLDLAAAHGGR